MGLLNLFKKKKPAEKKKGPEKKKIAAVVKPKVRKKAETGSLPETRPTVRKRKKISGRMSQILYSPHVTEKTTAIEEEGKYVFKVLPGANKKEIERAVGDLYGVDVVDVKIINIPRRKRRLGRQTGWKKGYKKAIVKVEKGQKIEILPR